MSYKVIQRQKNGKFYLYLTTAEWDPVKKQSRQKREYLGPCDENGNLISVPIKRRNIQCSPVFGPYYLLHSLANDSELTDALIDIYGETDGKQLLALAILGVVSPCSINQIENEIQDTYLREIIKTDLSFEQSRICRLMQNIGKDTGSREKLFSTLRPDNGCVIFDIVCLGTDSQQLDFAEMGRKAHTTGSKQFNLGMVHSMKNNLPFCYRTYPGSVADVTTLDNLSADLKRMGCKSIEIVLDRGFFSVGNIKLMIERNMGFTIPIPARNNINKLLISESVGNIDSALCTDILNGSTVRGYETKTSLVDGKFVKASQDDTNAIRAVVFQDDDRRNSEINNLYAQLAEFESKITAMKYNDDLAYYFTYREKEIAPMYDFFQGEDGRTVVKRKRNAIAAKENACGRFVVLTTSKLMWKDILIEYRKRNDVEYNFSQLQSDLFNGVKGKSNHDSVEGGLLVNFLSLRLRLTLIDRMKKAELTNSMWVPELIRTLKKLKISCVGEEWRLNEITRAQRDIFKKLGVKLP